MRAHLTIFLLLVAPAANAQRSFTLLLAPTNGNGYALSWKAQSATPIGDLFVVPEFQLERSHDLKTWEPISGRLSATLGQRITMVDSNSSPAFYRVNSIISKAYAQLSHVKLDSGQLEGADFFGANLFGASLAQARLTGSSFSGADLRQADFSEADLSGADLFGVQASDAIFDFAGLANVDASFGDFEAASFFSADLSGADFSFSILTGADLSFAIWNGVILDQNTLIDDKPHLIWQIVNQGAVNANLINQDLSFASFLNVNFRGARLNNSDLSASDLRGADVRGANLTSALRDLWLPGNAHGQHNDHRFQVTLGLANRQ